MERIIAEHDKELLSRKSERKENAVMQPPAGFKMRSM
jgi:hypothetical protein